jgi:hypothetical protein
VEKMKYWSIPMLYYNDHIPDVELCKLGHDAKEDGIDASTKNIRNEYATKMLLFFPFLETSDFPVFDNRWCFLRECISNGVLYWDAARLMQNIQDVENTKKIVTMKDELAKKTENPNILVEHYMDHGESEEEEDRDFNAFHDDDRNYDDVNLDLIAEEFGIQDNLFQGVILGENVIGSLNSGMKESHIISDPISQNSSVVLFENEEERSHVHPEFGIGVNQTQPCDVVKVILNLDESQEIRGTGENRENGSLNWGNISDNSDFNFNDFSLSMKCCIQHFNLDPKEAAAFNMICSSFMLSFLNDPAITKLEQILRRKMQQEFYWEKGLIQD